MALFDIFIQGKKGSTKDQAFVDLFSIVKEAEPLLKIDLIYSHLDFPRYCINPVERATRPEI